MFIPAWRRGGVGAEGEGDRGTRRRRGRGRGRPWAAAASGPRRRGGAAAWGGVRGGVPGGVPGGVRVAGAGRGRRGGVPGGGRERRGVVTERVSGEKGEKGRTRESCLFASLPSARDLALDKDFFKNIKIFFVECQIAGTRQNVFYRVPAG
jgi:hypothetical protein